MYKKKLKEQLILLEEQQKKCSIGEISEFLELGKNILAIAKKLDELDKSETE